MPRTGFWSWLLPAVALVATCATAVVVVGGSGQIEAGIRALNEGPLSLRDLWGQEIR